MKPAEVLVVFCALCFGAEEGRSSPSCLDESGRGVDWIIVYKFPPIKFYHLRYGESYAYISSNNIGQTGKWVLSKQNISSNNSIISKILNPVIKKKRDIAYLVYNDAVPNEKHYSDKFGHAKGVLAFDNDSGYWMIHSIPKFPQEGYYNFPRGSTEHGQIFICVNFNIIAINQIGEQLRYMKPQIYMNHSTSAVLKLSPLVQTLFTSNPSFINHVPWMRNVTLSSKLGAKFISFSKQAKFLKGKMHY
ncbi:plancitoxin-1-like isoform X1 [Centruroides sculpturatus]|uniref:plancitoxin-1-like isoform X1 n=1 Tax=Centruroides sculpturatus TaxID=218467 RepID=UPI000C6CEC21|nr:plancitoxin-1-like isoform X1 [Centruroides sculpturatus]